MFWVCNIVLALSACLIVYQDLKSRLISIGSILAFAVACFFHYLQNHSGYALLENSIFCTCYFLLCYLVLHLFYFVRTGAFQKLLDSKIGWGDILLLFITGSCLPPQDMIFFFTLTFIIALVHHVFFSKVCKTIALGAILLICYLARVIYLRDL